MGALIIVAELIVKHALELGQQLGLEKFNMLFAQGSGSRIF
jgi:hypothetical protein